MPPPGRDGSTERQRITLTEIRRTVAARGYPPSVREIGEVVGLTSPSSVNYQLKALERKGYIRRDPHRPRALEGSCCRTSLTTPAVATTGPLPIRTAGRADRGRRSDSWPRSRWRVLFPLPAELVGDGELFPA